jgi:hypothetical protein
MIDMHTIEDNGYLYININDLLLYLTTCDTFSIPLKEIIKDLKEKIKK